MIHAKEGTLALIREKCLHPVIGLTVITKYLEPINSNSFKKNAKAFKKPHGSDGAIFSVTSFICFRFPPEWNLGSFYVFS